MPACDLDRSVTFAAITSEKNQTHSCPFFRGKYRDCSFLSLQPISDSTGIFTGYRSWSNVSVMPSTTVELAEMS